MADDASGNPTISKAGFPGRLAGTTVSKKWSGDYNDGVGKSYSGG